MINRLEQIQKQELLDSYMLQSRHKTLDFSKIKVGDQFLKDATLNFGNLSEVDPRFTDKTEILKAMYSNNYQKMRDVSNFFFKISGIYSRLCRYLAKIYRFDWMITPCVYSDKNKEKASKMKENFYHALNFLDQMKIKETLGEITLKVIRNGCYYGYLVPGTGVVNIQELPPKYCRSRYKVNGRYAIEFNMRFFDEMFPTSAYRQKVLNLFPKEFKKGYILYKQGKLPLDYPGDTCGWYLLDINNAFKFNIDGEDFPFLIDVIPAIIDLDNGKGLDRQLMAQKLLKLVIQKLPLDKNGDPIFDIDEAGAIHNNAVRMLAGALGLKVLTSFADVSVEDMQTDTSRNTTDDLQRLERAVYNEAGVSQMQFNTDGNIALEKSILNDEASLYSLICQYEDFYNYILAKTYNTNKVVYKFQLLSTTIYNYKEMAKLYKEQTQLGYSKFLPQIALGQSQMTILANAYFENEVLDLVNVFIPPLMSSTMSGNLLNSKGKVVDKNGGSAQQDNKSDTGGRPEKPDDEKSTKTLQNKESQS